MSFVCFRQYSKLQYQDGGIEVDLNDTNMKSKRKRLHINVLTSTTYDKKAPMLTSTYNTGLLTMAPRDVPRLFGAKCLCVIY